MQVFAADIRILATLYRHLKLEEENKLLLSEEHNSYVNKKSNDFLIPLDIVQIL